MLVIAFPQHYTVPGTVTVIIYTAQSTPMILNNDHF